MLQKMGFKEGMRLGARGDGLSEPLSIHMRNSKLLPAYVKQSLFSAQHTSYVCA